MTDTQSACGRTQAASPPALGFALPTLSPRPSALWFAKTLEVGPAPQQRPHSCPRLTHGDPLLASPGSQGLEVAVGVGEHTPALFPLSGEERERREGSAGM